MMTNNLKNIKMKIWHRFLKGQAVIECKVQTITDIERMKVIMIN